MCYSLAKRERERARARERERMISIMKTSVARIN
jgi:hypothetical protein